MPTIKTTVTIDKTLRDKIDKLALKTHRTRSNCIEYLLHCAVDLPEFMGGPTRREAADNLVKKSGFDIGGLK